jgi:hypothetical protein
MQWKAEQKSCSIRAAARCCGASRQATRRAVVGNVRRRKFVMDRETGQSARAQVIWVGFATAPRASLRFRWRAELTGSRRYALRSQKRDVRDRARHQ